MSESFRALRRAGILPFYAFAFFEGFVPVYPVYMILFAERGMDYGEISLLIAIWAIPVVLLEIPSGIAADRIGKRPLMVAGMLMKALCFLVWAVSPGFAGAAAGFILWACQEAFCSGAKQALLYERVASVSLQSEYERIAASINALEMISIGLALVVGSPLYAASPLATLLASSACSLCAALVARRFAASPPAGEEAEGPAGKGAFAALRSALRGRRIGGLAAAACLAGGIYGLVDEYDGLWSMEAYGLPLAWVGFWGAARFAVQGLGGLAAPLVGRLARRRLGFPAAISAAGACMCAAALCGAPAGIAAYAVYYAFLSALEITLEARLQEIADDANRATILSAYNLAGTLCAIPISLAFGAAMDATGLKGGFLAAGILTVCSAPFASAAPRGRSEAPRSSPVSREGP